MVAMTRCAFFKESCRVVVRWFLGHSVRGCASLGILAQLLTLVCFLLWVYSKCHHVVKIFSLKSQFYTRRCMEVSVSMSED